MLGKGRRLVLKTRSTIAHVCTREFSMPCDATFMDGVEAVTYAVVSIPGQSLLIGQWLNNTETRGKGVLS